MPISNREPTDRTVCIGLPMTVISNGHGIPAVRLEKRLATGRLQRRIAVEKGANRWQHHFAAISTRVPGASSESSTDRLLRHEPR